MRSISRMYSLLNGDVKAGNTRRVNEFFVKMKKYQEVSSGNSLPTTTSIRQNASIMPFLLQPFSSWQTSHWLHCPLLHHLSHDEEERNQGIEHRLLPILLGVSFFALTFGLALRWIISGNIPMSNGYESMLTVAWFVMLISILMHCASAS